MNLSFLSIYYNNNSIIRIQGGFFGGGKEQLLKWCEYYIDELNQFEKYKVFAGKDQYIMGSIYLKYKYYFDTFIPKNNIYNISENEIVYIQDKGAYKRNQITFRVLTKKGELFQLYANQLETIPEHQWPDLASFQIARKTLLTKEQLEGYPLLIKIEEVTDEYISGYLINNNFISISRKLVPKLPCINPGNAEFIFVPQWYYEKRIMNIL